MTIFDADYNYWSKMHRWNVHQAVCLALGIDPNKYNSKYNFLSNYDRPLPFLAEYKQIKQLFINHFSFLAVDIEPLEFIKWARGLNIPFPDELELLIKQTANNSQTGEHFREWFSEYIKHDFEKVPTKKIVLEEYNGQYPQYKTQVWSIRSELFQKVWDELAPANWKKQGRRKAA